MRLPYGLGSPCRAVTPDCPIRRFERPHAQHEAHNASSTALPDEGSGSNFYIHSSFCLRYAGSRMRLCFLPEVDVRCTNVPGSDPRELLSPPAELAACNPQGRQSGALLLVRRPAASSRFNIPTLLEESCRRNGSSLSYRRSMSFNLRYRVASAVGLCLGPSVLRPESEAYSITSARVSINQHLRDVKSDGHRGRFTFRWKTCAVLVLSKKF